MLVVGDHRIAAALDDDLRQRVGLVQMIVVGDDRHDVVRLDRHADRGDQLRVAPQPRRQLRRSTRSICTYPPRRQTRPSLPLRSNYAPAPLQPPSLEGRQDVSRQPLDLPELVERAEAADEVIDAGGGERAHPVRDVVRGAHRTPLADIHRLAQLGVVLADVGVDAGLCLLPAVGDVHRHLVGHHELVTGATGFVDRLLDLRELSGELLRVAGAAAGHPAVAVAGDAARGAADDALRLVLLPGADGQPRIADHPDRRRCLHGSERTHLGSGVERDVVEGIVLTLEAGLARRPELAQNGQAFLEDPGPLLEIETDSGVLPAHALLGIAHPRTQDGAAAGELVERRPFERQVERMAGAGDHAGGAELDAAGALRDGGEEGDRFPARFGEEAVTHPDRIESRAPRRVRPARADRTGCSRARSTAPDC